MRAVLITEFGGPEVLRPTEVDDATADGDRLLVEVSTAGVNYADTHQTENSYLAPQQLPMIPGAEVVGRVVGGPRDGQRVVALLGSGGGYAQRAAALPQLAVEVPDDVDDAAALALVVQGTTAWHLLRTSTRLEPGESVVVHSAAGGVGSLAVQLARAWGAGRVIGTASDPDKRKLAEELGADVAVDLSGTTDAEQVQTALRDANGGRGVDVVLEMTGGHVFDGSLAALAPLGRLATFGMASRTPPEPVDVSRLMARSTTVTGFWLVHALGRPGGLGHPLAELFSMLRVGALRTISGGSYPLAAAAAAHQALLSRRTVGKLVLDVRA